MHFEMIFNLRVGPIHLQIDKDWSIKPFFNWRNFCLGFLFNKEKSETHICLFPTFGLKITKIRFVYNKSFKLGKMPFIWLFQYGSNYRQMRRYEDLKN